MAKIKTKKELINFAKNLGINVSNKSLNEVGEAAINILSESLQENHITDYIAVNKENRKIEKNIEEIKNVLAYDDPKGCCVLYSYYYVDEDEYFNSKNAVLFVGTKEQCEEYLKEGTLGSVVVSHKSERIKAMVDEFIANQKKEECAMETTNTTVINNNNKTIKEEKDMMNRMEEIAQALTNNQKVQDVGYIDRKSLKKILNEEFNMVFNNKATRESMVEAFFAMYKDAINTADEIAYIESDATHQVICTDHAYYDNEFIVFKGTEEQCEEYASINNCIDGETGIASYKVESLNTKEITKADIEADAQEQIEIHELMHGVQETQEQVIAENDVAFRSPMIPKKVIAENDGTIRSIIATCCNVQWNNKKQIAKNYISRYMIESCINRTLHGKWNKDLRTSKDNIFTDDQKTATQEMLNHLLDGPYFVSYKDNGYIIKAEYMAWFYETQLHKHLVYRFTFEDKKKGYVDYKIDRANSVIINLRDNKTTALDEKGWETINKTLNFKRVVD